MGGGGILGNGDRMMSDAIKRFFGEPFDSRQEAEAAYKYDLFNPAAVFVKIEKYTDDEPVRYYLAYIRDMSGKPWATAQALHEKTGYMMVSTSDPITGIFKPFYGGPAGGR
jgi:hypothetical protein